MKDKITLKYPKSLFTQKEVFMELKHFEYKEAWKLSEDDEDYILTFNKRLIRKKK